MKLAISALVAAVLASGAAVATNADACGFFDYREVRPVRVHPAPVAANDRIATADQRLDEEKPDMAAAEVVTAFPTIRKIAVGASPIETRALRILSLAVVRRDGALATVKGFAGANESDRTGNIEWALSTLRGIDALRQDDPVTRADLAEALAKSPKHEDESFAILAELSERDLVGSAHAYATLARQRASRGDATGAHTALERCQLMTRSPSAVCREPDGRVALRD